jgi:hypothetical protein
MKKVTLIAAVLIGILSLAQPALSQASTSPNATNPDDLVLLKKDIQSQRKQIVAANMTLTEQKQSSSGPFTINTRSSYRKSMIEGWHSSKNMRMFIQISPMSRLVVSRKDGCKPMKPHYKYDQSTSPCCKAFCLGKRWRGFCRLIGVSES